MRIGLDIDNVILDFDQGLLEAMLLEDKNKRNKGIVNPDADYILSGMFDWSKEEIDSFLNENMERIAKQFKPLENAKYYMDKLLEEEHELYLISNRTFPHYKNAWETTVKSLEQNQLSYTKLIITPSNNKSKECIENKIDIFFDDRKTNCDHLKSQNVPCCLMKGRYEKRKLQDLDTVSTWKELYEKIKKIGEKR